MLTRVGNLAVQRMVCVLPVLNVVLVEIWWQLHVSLHCRRLVSHTVAVSGNIVPTYLLPANMAAMHAAGSNHMSAWHAANQGCTSCTWATGVFIRAETTVPLVQHTLRAVHVVAILLPSHAYRL